MGRRVNKSVVQRLGTKVLTAALLGSTCVYALSLSTAFQAQAQTARQVSFNIPAGSLSSALANFGRQAGMQVTYQPQIASAKQAPAVSGMMTPQDALSRLLAGSGISHRFTGSNTVALAAQSAATQAPLAADGTTLLDTITVTSGAGVVGAEAPYQTAAPTNYISSETIERFRGSSPADIFRGTPGVMSGEARNGAGSVDVNIRGMQGMGRVATTIDGAENSVTVYQGYQGLSNRTYIDPDLIAGIDINKGSDASSRGIAGNVAIRTLDADDIVKEGDNWGMRVKGEYGSNSSSPHAGAKGGYAWPYSPSDVPEVVGSPDGMNRPSFLTPTNGSASIVAAIKEENYDFFAGYAYRKRGNYHAGKHGPSADPVNIGPARTCNTSGSWCQNWPEYIENGGLTNYRAGEEVLNTQLETKSFLTKATLRFDGGHTLKLGYTGFRGEAGDLLASRFTGDRNQPVQQELTSGSKLDTGTLRYYWNPDDNELIDLKANLWVTKLELRNPRRGNMIPTSESLGLSPNFRTGSNTIMWGGDVANTSKFSFGDYGDLDLNYGVSYLREDTRPSAYTNELEGWLNLRDAYRDELGVFTKAAYKPVDWLTLNAGLRYSHYWSHDRRTEANSAVQLNPEPNRDSGGFSPSVGVTVEPFDGSQLYVNYSDALRYPSLFESVSAFTVIPNAGLQPERSSNWEVGANFTRDGLLNDDDRGMVKFGYFNWDVKDYVARAFRDFYDDSGKFVYSGMQVYNIDRARFSGLEFSSRYEAGGFTADFSANYYLDVEFCRTSDTCGAKSLYGDYATNQVPPKYSVDLTLSQKMLEDRLTLGGRVSYVGPRAIGHGDVTAVGAGEFISLTRWKPYTLIDVFAEYKINDSLTATARIENLTDQYYVDPLGLVNQPGPGRTFYAGLTSNFGGNQRLPQLSPFSRSQGGAPGIDWTGFYGGVHAGMTSGRTWGNTTALDGTVDPISASESADRGFGNSALFGVQAGYNHQFSNRVVLGIEADVSKTRLKGAQAAFMQEDWIAAEKDIAGIQANTHYDIDWTGSIRGRLGYALDNRWLVYGTAGVAFAHEKQTRDQYRYSEDIMGKASSSLFFVDQLSGMRTGVTVGGGVEYAINDRWSVMADYTYSRFGNRSFSFENARAGTGGNYTTREQTGVEITPPEPFLCEILGDPYCDPSEKPIYKYTDHTGSSNIVNGRKASNSLDTHTVKLGLNFHF